MRTSFVAFVSLLGAAVIACSGGGNSSGSACDGVAVDRFKELLVVDDSVTTDARASNGSDGPWSFRYLIENLAPAGTDPGDFVWTWFTSWVSATQFNTYPLDLPGEGRTDGMNTKVLCPWLKRSPANACNSDCSVCTTKKLDLAQAPFRLTAISNRMDERATFPQDPNGEGRLIYALTDGAGDATTSMPLAFALVFEYTLPQTKSLQDWAKAWHALGSFPDLGDGYKSALENITDSFVKRGSNPNGKNGGSALARIRTNESALDWIWQQRMFALGDDGSLALQPTFNTPARQLNGSQQLHDFIAQNGDAIKAQKAVVPPSMLGGSSDAVQFDWHVDGVDPATLLSFAQQTCNGCHTNSSVVDTAFHLSPFRHGVAKVSSFINDPAGGHDQLTDRTQSMRAALCGGP